MSYTLRDSNHGWTGERDTLSRAKRSAITLVESGEFDKLYVYRGSDLVGMVDRWRDNTVWTTA